MLVVNGYVIYSGADLTGADLSGEDLTGADLSHANLSFANLSGATLSGANLSGATLDGANLNSANLNSANLNSAILTGTNLISANLNNATLIGANLPFAFLYFADLSNANLRQANLENSQQVGAHLVGADLTEANLINTDLSSANFRNAILTSANLFGANLTSANLSSTQLNYDVFSTIVPATLNVVSTLEGSNITGTLQELHQIAVDYFYLDSSVTLTISDIEQWTNADIADLQASTDATVIDSLNPILIGASTNADGTTVTLTFDENLTGDNTSVDHFEISGDREIPISSLSIINKIVTLNISDDTPITESENLTVSLVVESITDSSGNAVSLSAVDIANNSTVPAMNTIPSIVGRGRLEGTDEADLFAFLEFDSFKRRNADRIINFNPSQGDKIGVSIEAFPSLAGANEISFASARTRREMRSFSRQDIDLVYYERNGRLFANGNGEERGWGNRNEGGLMAILQGAPELTADDFTLLT